MQVFLFVRDFLSAFSNVLLTASQLCHFSKLYNIFSVLFTFLVGYPNYSRPPRRLYSGAQALLDMTNTPSLSSYQPAPKYGSSYGHFGVSSSCLPGIADQWNNSMASLDKVDQEGSSDDRAAGTSNNFRWCKTSVSKLLELYEDPRNLDSLRTKLPRRKSFGKTLQKVCRRRVTT